MTAHILLLTRELPPTRLAVNVQLPRRQMLRWAADEPRAANVLQRAHLLSLGAGWLRVLLAEPAPPPNLSYPDLERLSTVTVTGAGQIAWEGRIESVPRSTWRGHSRSAPRSSAGRRTSPTTSP